MDVPTRCFRGQKEGTLHLHSLARDQSDGPNQTGKELGRWSLSMCQKGTQLLDSDTNNRGKFYVIGGDRSCI